MCQQVLCEKMAIDKLNSAILLLKLEEGSFFYSKGYVYNGGSV